MRLFAVVFAGLISCANAQAMSRTFLASILETPEVKAQLTDSSQITSMTFTKENVATTWTYRIDAEVDEAGLGPNGPSTHPCFVTIVVDVIGGFAGNIVSAPVVTKICAQNTPQPQ